MNSFAWITSRVGKTKQTPEIHTFRRFFLFLLTGQNNAMFKSELAEQYGVHSATLKRWITGNPQLMEELTKIGYIKHRNLLTAKEISIIMEYLGG
jgi:hypothetical protein